MFKRIQRLVVVLFAAAALSIGAPLAADAHTQSGGSSHHQQYRQNHHKKCGWHKAHKWKGHWVKGHYHKCKYRHHRHHNRYQHSSSNSNWDRLAKCESGGNWRTNTGNGYSGGLQFHPRTWRAYGGHGSAHNASKSEQIQVAKRLHAEQGFKPWPKCSSKLGLR